MSEKTTNENYSIYFHEIRLSRACKRRKREVGRKRGSISFYLINFFLHFILRSQNLSAKLLGILGAACCFHVITISLAFPSAIIPGLARHSAKLFRTQSAHLLTSSRFPFFGSFKEATREHRSQHGIEVQRSVRN